MSVQVELVECMAEDRMVVNAARVLADKWRPIGWTSELDSSDKRLIEMMMKERHGTPFEHNYFQFRVTVPIFVQRDWFKHRIGSSFNEISTRWQDMSEQPVYAPVELRQQKEGTKRFEYQYTPWDKQPFWHWWFKRRLRKSQERSLRQYHQLMTQGVAMEQAMAVLPMGMDTTFIWSCNARSLMHFLSLRTDKHARAELRHAAGQVESYFRDAMPVTWQSWMDNGRVAP